MEPLGPIADAIARIEPLIPAQLWPWAIVGIGAVLAIGVHALLWAIVNRTLRGHAGLWVSVARRLRRPSRLLLLVLVAFTLVQSAGLSEAWRGALGQIAAALIFTIVGWSLVIAIDAASERALRRLSFADEEDNLAARKQSTQVKLLQRIARILVAMLTAGFVLSTFDAVRQFGVSLFASAGVAGIVLGFAARPVLANLIAGIQIALTQPIRLDDVVIVENEWGWIEEIAATYVVVRIWDLRRLVVPLSYFIEQPFQNWTRESGEIIGSVLWHVDYGAPIAEMRTKLEELVRASRHWDRKVVNLQVVDSDRDTLQVRGLMSARTSPAAWDLRCEVREKMLAWLRETHPESLPRLRTGARMGEERRAPWDPEVAGLARAKGQAGTG